MVDTPNTVADTKGHGLLCPTCKVDLVMAERQGIEIDYCPKCRGVWLDRGELDKIIERSTNAAPEQGAQEQGVPVQNYPSQDRSYDNRHGGHGGHGGYGRGRRRSFLSEIFD